VLDGNVYADAHIRCRSSTLNRHGLIAGATVPADEDPAVLADSCPRRAFGGGRRVKATCPGWPGRHVHDKITQRARTGDDWAATAYPVEFLASAGSHRRPLRATMTSFGPTLLSKVLGLNDTQESSLGLVFHYADQNGLGVAGFKDLRAVIQYLVSDEGRRSGEPRRLSSATAA